jgi:hypothetical protein
MLWELLKCIGGAAIIYFAGDWFGSDATSPVIRYIITAYLAVSAGVTYFFYKNQAQDLKNELLAQ